MARDQEQDDGGKPGAGSGREDRLAAQLRANLKRRKGQGHARRGGAGAKETGIPAAGAPDHLPDRPADDGC